MTRDAHGVPVGAFGLLFATFYRLFVVFWGIFRRFIASFVIIASVILGGPEPVARLNELNEILHFHDSVLVVPGVAHSVSHSVSHGKAYNLSKSVVEVGHRNIFEKRYPKLINHLRINSKIFQKLTITILAQALLV